MKNPVCPKCGFVLPELQQARAGRAGRGKAKARTSEQARAAANKRWDAYKASCDKIMNEREIAIANEAALPASKPANRAYGPAIYMESRFEEKS